jgi:signal peptidase I
MKYARDIITTILVALIIFVVLQVTIGSFKVYGMCMLPNVENGDYIMVSKLSYTFKDPQRGDVIIFHSPRDQNSDLIKRIIGMPGDTIEITGGEVLINGKPLDEPYIMEAPRYEYPAETIPEDEYFVLGDNRNNSADSHTGWLLPRYDIVGKAWVNYWPIEGMNVIKHYSYDANSS